MSPDQGIETKDQREVGPEAQEHGVDSAVQGEIGIAPTSPLSRSSTFEIPTSGITNVTDMSGEKNSANKAVVSDDGKNESGPEVTSSGFIKGNGDTSKASFWQGLSGQYTWI